MDLQNTIDKVKNMLPEKRFNHSLNVAKTAKELGKIYGYDEDKAYLAGILHDNSKYLDKKQVQVYVDKYNIELDELEKDSLALSHSIIGSYIAKYEFNIDDNDIINAIRYHTTGRENMILLEKIIYISDLIEQDRNFPGVDALRILVYDKKLDEALLISYNNTIKFVIDNNQTLHERTIKARNYILNELKLNSNMFK